MTAITTSQLLSSQNNSSAQDRLLPVFGADGLAKLSGACVMVIGLGGVGSSCVEALARGGIGHLILVDRDVVEPSNINRQALAFHSTIGMAKTDAMRQMIADINPACKVETHHLFVTRDNLPELFEPYLGKLDYVIDAIDTISQKLELAYLVQKLEREGRGFPLVAATGAANKVRPELLQFADISQTHTCPLCKDLRKLCRKRGVKKLEVLFSTEVPLNRVKGTAAGERSPLGTASFMPPIMGQMLAGHVICRIASIKGGPDAGVGGAGAGK
ncbi:tRNA threonylcarbamoyladenosine dehydratase [Atopobium sp. oral taxon 810]|uniref:tRNA threonylcarbamoyladenosine dehydratase n=1 Tax=Atopobium sp. oral taxon 810 TaxID=712158 RepID=UPI000396DA04|nr:tRNA threonylcarbamoyladenosine dehydratase [Atopobium sp. oral taxon 810]ERI03967.1 ThiF family protein [Atopobium sp. oral taxon 810 str. F0209]